MQTSQQQTPQPDQTTALQRPSLDVKKLNEAFRRGDRPGIVEAFREAYPSPDDLADALVNFALDLRRENVAVIGDHEAFVRRFPTGVHGEAGELRQVIAPVRLSLEEGTLYQIPKGSFDGNNQWREVIEDPFRANVSAQGLNRINQVAGCAVGQPAEVMVDGQPRTNPYCERKGRDITRIVIAVHVVGPSPYTGNPVVVQYTLDVDPGLDLMQMLMNLTFKHSDQVYLESRDDWESRTREERRGWMWLPLNGPVGIAHNLRHKEVEKAYKKMIGISQDALKKAQTVARRNAMKAHPALAYNTVKVNEKGEAVIRGVGWTASVGDMAGYMAMLERASRGIIPDLEEIEIVETYDPEKHVTGNPDMDATTDEATDRDRLVSTLDDLVGALSDADLIELGYQGPEGLSDEDLRALISKASRMIEAYR